MRILVPKDYYAVLPLLAIKRDYKARNRVASRNPVSVFLENFQAEKKGPIALRGVSLVSGFPVPGRAGNFPVLARTAMIG
jgi:hypothetical protein